MYIVIIHTLLYSYARENYGLLHYCVVSLYFANLKTKIDVITEKSCEYH